MNDESQVFSMQILKNILNVPILSYYCCEKIDGPLENHKINNSNKSTEIMGMSDNRKDPDSHHNKLHKEIAVLTYDHLIFLSKKGIKTRIPIMNIAKVSIDGLVLIIYLKEALNKNELDFGYRFIIHNRHGFIDALSSQYLTYTVLKTGLVNQLKIEIKNTFKKNKTTINNHTHIITEDQFGFKKCFYKGYRFDLSFHLEKENDAPNIFKTKKDSEGKQSVIKVFITKIKPNEKLLADSMERNFKSYSLNKLGNSIRLYYSDYIELILTSSKEISKIEEKRNWVGWEYSLKARKKKSKRINIMFTFLRRKCIPSLYETYQDFILILEENFNNEYDFGEFDRNTRQAYDSIIQTLAPQEKEEENSVTQLLFYQRISSYLVDSDTLQLFYSTPNKFNSSPPFKSLFRFANDLKYKLLLIDEKYEKSESIVNMKKKCIEFVNEIQTHDNPINIDNYMKTMQYCSFHDLIDNECKVIRQFLTSISSKAYLLWRNKLLNYLEFVMSEAFSESLFEDLIILATKVPISYNDLSGIFSDFINFQALNEKDEIIPDVSISSIMSNLPIIKEIYYNEKFLTIFIMKDILKKIQGIESDLIYYQFLNYLLEKNFSLTLLEAIHCFLNNTTKNFLSPNYKEGFAFESAAIKKYSNVFLLNLMNIYRNHSESVDIIILATKCLIMISSIDPMNKRELLNSDICFYLDWYLKSFDQNLVYYSVLLFNKLTESNFDIRCLVEKHSSIIIKMINIIKGSKIQNCSFHPQTLLTVLDLFGYLLQNNQVKEFLCDYSRRKWIKYLLRIIANPKSFVGKYIEYYLMILIAVYEVLTIIVKKNKDVRLYLQTEFHLLKLIDSKCKQYMLLNRGDLNYKELLLETLMDFMKEFIGNDLTMQQYARMNGKNILEYSLQLKNNTISQILYSN